MKLRLLTDAELVQEPIRFVALNAWRTEKGNSQDRVTADEKISNCNDIQGSEE